MSAETGEPDGVTSDRLSTEPRSLLIFLPRLSQVLNVPREALGPKYVMQVATMLPLGGGGALPTSGRQRPKSGGGRAAGGPASTPPLLATSPRAFRGPRNFKERKLGCRHRKGRPRCRIRPCEWTGTGIPRKPEGWMFTGRRKGWHLVPVSKRLLKRNVRNVFNVPE